MAYTTINKHTDYFRTKLYTGNASNDRAITFDESTNMQPDFIWIKNRSATQSHALFDAVRGATKRLTSNGTGAESTENTNLDSFDTNGFTVDNEAIVNGSGNNMVAWNWKANGAGSSNTDGTITSTVSANTTAGFSIVSYTGNGTAGATVGHGLNSAPDLVIGKKRSGTANWDVWGDLLGSTNMMNLNTTAASFNPGGNYHNDTMPTSTVVTLGNDADINGSSETYIMYCFHSVKGYSKIGSYTGNGNADGTFVYTGFKPAFILARRTGATDNWVMYDNKRSGYNPQNDRLYPNGNFAEEGTTNRMFDMLSNGFKARENWTTINSGASTYIYMAFGQSLVGSNNVPCTAR